MLLRSSTRSIQVAIRLPAQDLAGRATSVAPAFVASLDRSNLHFGVRSIHASQARYAGRKGQLSQSERQILGEISVLKKQIDDDAKMQLSKASSADLPELTEETLELLYEALNTSDPPTEEDVRLEGRRRKLLDGETGRSFLDQQRRRAALRLADVSERLGEIKLLTQPIGSVMQEDHSTRLLRVLQVVKEQEASDEDSNLPDTSQTARQVEQVEQTAVRDEVSAPSVLAQIEEALLALHRNAFVQSPLPLGILTKQDWKALSRSSASANDLDSFSQTLALMERSGQASQRTDVANVALDIVAHQGNVTACQSFIAAMQVAGVALDSYSSHCLLKSFVRANRLDDAIATLKSLEATEPASLPAYTLVIEGLLQQHTQPGLQSKAWPLFTQMRLAAHPVPDAPLYAQMIKACALGVRQPDDNVWRPTPSLLAASQARKAQTRRPGRNAPDTERALDLFREMTLRYNVRPTPEVYTSVILACTRRREMYRKGIEIFQSMLEIERQRVTSGEHDSPSFAPVRETYNALLQGCAQHGDLLRARWILAEMLRSSMALWTSLQQQDDVQRWEMLEAEARKPNEETLALVFFSYASYDPPSRRSIEKTLPSKVTGSDAKTSTLPEENASTDEKEQSLTTEGTFTERMPESSSAVVREVDGLIERVATDANEDGGLLKSVKPNSRMLNAYLAVLSKHCKRTERLSRIEKALFGSTDGQDSGGDAAVLDGASLFHTWGVPINGFTCEVVLDACVKDADRARADALASKIWSHWQSLSEHVVQGSGTELIDNNVHRALGIDAVRIGRCWAAMIRNLAKSNRIEEAMNMLRSFVEQFPPPSHSGSSFGARRTPQETISRPTLTFQQLELLYNRLVLNSAGEAAHSWRSKSIAFLTWAAKSYEASLRPRIPSVLKRSGPVFERYTGL